MFALKSIVILALFITHNLMAKNTLSYNEELILLNELKFENMISQTEYDHLLQRTNLSKPLIRKKTLGGSSIINGHIENTSAVAIINQSVSLYELIGGVRSYVDTTQTDGLGDYSFTALNAGTYLVYAFNYSDDYLDYSWNSGTNDICTLNRCLITVNNHIDLAASATINGIDFIFALGGVITGSIIDASSSIPVGTLTPQVYNTNNNSHYSVVASINQATGTYIAKGVPDGNYKVYLEYTDFFNTTENNEHIAQIYGGPECNYCSRLVRPGIGAEINIAMANTVSNIDFSLNVGASISGNLVDNNTISALTEIGFIFLFDDANSFLGYKVVLGTADNPMADGSYYLGGLLPGNYFVQGGDAGRDFYQRELYSNRPCYYGGCDRSLGDLVPLAALEHKLGINFLLEKGGKISGNVVDAITGLALNLEDGGLALIEFLNNTENVIGSAYVRTDGTYIAGRALPAGNYSVRTGSMFYGSLSQPYLNEKYNNIPCAGLACDLSVPNVNVVNDLATANIDFSLNTGNSFTGTVTDLNTSAPLSGVNILVYKDMGMGQVKFANWAITGDGSPGNLPVGEFLVSGLDDGTYYARTGYGSDLPFFISSFRNIGGAAPAGWIDILYDGMPCLEGCDVTTGTPIVLPVINKTTSGVPGPIVNFGLLQGAVITGKVSDFIQNGPLKEVNIKVYNDQGTFMGSSITDTQGNYITRGLPAGTYYLITSSLETLIDVKYGNEFCLIGNCNPLDAQPIIVTELETKFNQNFILKTTYMHMFSNDFE